MRRAILFFAAILGIAAFSFPWGMRSAPSAFAVPDKNEPASKTVEDILREIQSIPPAKASESAQVRGLRATDMPPLAKEKLAEYAYEGLNPFIAKFDSDSMAKAKKDHPLRMAAFEASSKIRETMELEMPEFLKKEEGLDAGARKNFLAQQKEPALAILDLEELLDDMKKLEEDRDKEKSKRWRARIST